MTSLNMIILSFVRSSMSLSGLTWCLGSDEVLICYGRAFNDTSKSYAVAFGLSKDSGNEYFIAIAR